MTGNTNDLIKYRIDRSLETFRFGLHFVQEGIVSKEDGRFFSDLYDRRQTGDYDDYVSYDEETVLQLYHRAEGFITGIVELIMNPKLDT